MNIIVGISHPKHVHIFRNLIKCLTADGNKVKIIAVNKGITKYLLDKYNLQYIIIGENKSFISRKVLALFSWEYKSLQLIRKIRPDLVIGRALPHLAHSCRIMKKPYIIFEDTELAKNLHRITVPFADAIVTPECYIGDFGRKHIRFNGYFELAYLHPNHFKPDPSVLDQLNLTKRDEFIILRLISWNAYHDIGLSGIQNPLKLIQVLEGYGDVFVTSEGKLNGKLEKYELNIPPEKIHSLLYYSNLYFGEGGTMAVEASILGTPSIHIESAPSKIATGELSGNFLELRDKYRLLYFYPNEDKAIKKAIDILENKNSKKEWRKRRKKLLKEKIDVTKWMQNLLENF